MSIINQNLLLTPEGYTISRSVRLRSSATPTFTRTPSSNGDSTKFTLSCWIKRTDLSINTGLMTCYIDPNNFFSFGYNSNQLWVFMQTGGVWRAQVGTTAVFRDPSSWYHVVMSLDTSGTVGAGTYLKIYINGVLQTLTTSVAPNGTPFTGMNSTSYQMQIGRTYAGGYSDQYLAEYYWIDGQVVAASAFGETDGATGVWKPKKYLGTYGTNGFYLNFSDNASLTRLGFDQRSGVQHVLIAESDGTAQTVVGVGACRISTISTTNYSLPSATNEYLSVTFDSPVPVTSSLKIYMDVNSTWANGRNLYINGTQVSSGNISVTTVSGMQEWTINYAAHGVSSLVSLTTPQNSAGRAFFYGISVDGTTVYQTANDWTTNNISLTAGVTYDSMLDVPTPYADGGNGRGNYAVLNPLDFGANGIKSVITEGNLKGSDAGSASFNSTSVSTIGVTSGKFYCEFTSITAFVQAGILYGLPTSDITAAGIRYYGSNGIIYKDGVSQGTFSTYTTNDVIGLALDADAKTIAFYKNNTLITTITYTSTNTVYLGALYPNTAGGGIYANFGQRPFTYTPPTGFKALNTQNLPDSTIKKGNQYFDVNTRTGTAASFSVTGKAFQPDLVWSKSRNNAYSNMLIDSSRGVGKWLQSDTTSTEGSDVTGLTSFNADGFSGGAQTAFNGSGSTMVDWLWKKGATQGFDIVTYTGTGANRTVAHSLGVTPSMVIIKNRTTATSWLVYHASVGNTAALFLNLTNASTASSTYFNNTSPTSSVFSVGTATSGNENGSSHVAYLFSEVAGFSKFGSYTGNGSSDGPFVYCGFRPRYVLVKESSIAGGNWFVVDSSRSPYNVSQQPLRASTSDAEGSGINVLDLTSNGFKIRHDSTTYSINNSGSTYIFAAFAESPFKNSLAR